MPVLCTGQYTDAGLSAVFLKAARLPAPQMLDGIFGQPRHAQVRRIVERFGALFAEKLPAAVLVRGDTNTASAAAQAANYAGAPVVHVDAGLRSCDRATPEELNRRVIGALADLHAHRAGRPEPASRGHAR